MQEGLSARAVRVLIADDVIHAVAGIAKLADYADVVDVIGLAREPMALFQEARLLRPDVLLLHEGFGDVDTAVLLEELAISSPASAMVLVVESEAAWKATRTFAAEAEVVPSEATGEELVAAILRAAARHHAAGVGLSAVAGAGPAEPDPPAVSTPPPGDPEPSSPDVVEQAEGPLDEPAETPAGAILDLGSLPSAAAEEVAGSTPAADSPIQPPRPQRVRKGVRNKAEVFIVFSGKGGVGKSLVATNLAVALSADGGRVAIVDLDLQFGDVAVMLHVEAHPTAIDALAQQGEQVDSDFIDEVMATGPEDVRILMAPASPEFADLVTTANLRAILREMSKTFDYIVVDAAAHLEERSLEVIELADQIIVVTGFNITSVKDTKITLKLLQSLGIPKERIAVVLNQTRARVNFPRSEVEESLRFPVVTQLPFEPRVDDCIDNGRPIVLAEPRSEFTRQFRTLVDFLTGGDQEDEAETAEGGRTRGRTKANRRRFSLGRG